MPFLTIEHVNKSFSQHKVLNDINLSIKEGEFISLLGYSGCGKSTLLRIIAGLESVDSGKVLLKKEDITNFQAQKRKFGMVFQSYCLFPHLSAFENLAFPLKENGFSNKKIKTIIAHSFELVGLSGNEHKYPRELSGGQQQRVAIAIALSLKPRVLLLDEPLSALDAKVRTKLRSDIKSIHRDLGITTIMVTHDQEEAIGMSDRIAILNNGEVVQIDTPKNIYTNPKDYFSATFIGEANCFKVKNEIHLLRPEHISIKKDGNENIAKIKDIEFLGSFLRITLDCVNKNQADCITSNISLKDFNTLNLKLGDKVSYDFNQKYLLRYKNVAMQG